MSSQPDCMHIGHFHRQRSDLKCPKSIQAIARKMEAKILIDKEVRGLTAGTYEEWHGINMISNGPGVLLKLQGADAIAYNTTKQNKTGMNVYQVLDVTDEAVFKNLNAKFNSSQTTPNKGDYKGSPNAHVIGDYKLLSNNCTSLVSDALNQTGSDALERMPNAKTGEQIKYRFILPASMQSLLEWQSGSWLGNGSVKNQGEY
jgi:hypothetical protein